MINFEGTKLGVPGLVLCFYIKENYILTVKFICEFLKMVNYLLKI